MENKFIYETNEAVANLINEGLKVTLDENLEESIKRLDVSAAKDLKKVDAMAKGFAADFDKVASKIYTAASSAADVVDSLATTARSVRIYLEDEFILDEEKYEALPPEFRKSAQKLLGSSQRIDSDLSGVSGALRGELKSIPAAFKALDKSKIGEFRSSLSEFMAAAKKEKIK